MSDLLHEPERQCSGMDSYCDDFVRRFPAFVELREPGTQFARYEHPGGHWLHVALPRQGGFRVQLMHMGCPRNTFACGADKGPHFDEVQRYLHQAHQANVIERERVVMAEAFSAVNSVRFWASTAQPGYDGWYSARFDAQADASSWSLCVVRRRETAAYLFDLSIVWPDRQRFVQPLVPLNDVRAVAEQLSHIAQNVRL